MDRVFVHHEHVARGEHASTRRLAGLRGAFEELVLLGSVYDADHRQTLIANSPLDNLLCDDSLLVGESVASVSDGTLIAVSDGWRGNMYRLAVVPQYRRRGIAKALVDEGERRLRREGCSRVTALVMHEHGWARSFLHAVGYDHDERVVRFVRNLA